MVIQVACQADFLQGNSRSVATQTQGSDSPLTAGCHSVRKEVGGKHDGDGGTSPRPMDCRGDQQQQAGTMRPLKPQAVTALHQLQGPNAAQQAHTTATKCMPLRHTSQANGSTHSNILSYSRTAGKLHADTKRDERSCATIVPADSLAALTVHASNSASHACLLQEHANEDTQNATVSAKPLSHASMSAARTDNTPPHCSLQMCKPAVAHCSLTAPPALAAAPKLLHQGVAEAQVSTTQAPCTSTTGCHGGRGNSAKPTEASMHAPAAGQAAAAARDKAAAEPVGNATSNMAAPLRAVPAPGSCNDGGAVACPPAERSSHAAQQRNRKREHADLAAWANSLYM